MSQRFRPAHTRHDLFQIAPALKTTRTIALDLKQYQENQPAAAGRTRETMGRDAMLKETIILVLVVCLMAVVPLPGAGALAQECGPEATPSAEQRARRQAAVRFVQQVNAAQVRTHAESGRYGPLAEIGNLASVPVGFVPRLTVDAWGYAISLKDLFDPCGFSLFSDQTGTIYEGRPIAPTD